MRVRENEINFVSFMKQQQQQQQKFKVVYICSIILKNFFWKLYSCQYGKWEVFLKKSMIYKKWEIIVYLYRNKIDFRGSQMGRDSVNWLWV